MRQALYQAEGGLLRTEENRYYTANEQNLYEAYHKQILLEGRAFLCDEERTLHVALGEFHGLLPAAECVFSRTGEVKEIAILSRVGKPVCCYITGFAFSEDGSLTPILSRKKAQEECVRRYIDNLLPGDVLDAQVTHLDPFGAFCDIGCGNIALMPIDCMSVSRINHPGERFAVGQKIRAVLKQLPDEKGRITLTHRELLGSWEENAERFQPGQTAAGIVRSIEPYGIFVELTPNLAGLAELKEGVTVGQNAAVYIKSILPQKMKIKLAIIDTCDGDGRSNDYRYPETEHMEYWQYSPECCSKRIETVF